MEDKKVKSAREIAMEKIAEMSKLTPQEAAELREKEYEPRGKVMANKYLGNALRKTDLEIELYKYQGEEREIVRKTFLSTLCQSIALEDMEKSRRAIEGMQTIEKSEHLDEIKSEIESIFCEFDSQRQQKYAQFGELVKEKLKRLWISGSAVKPRLKENADWQGALKEIQATYNLRLSKVKEEMTHYIT